MTDGRTFTILESLSRLKMYLKLHILEVGAAPGNNE